MDIEGKINGLFSKDEISINVKKVGQFDAKLVVSYRDTAEVIYLGIHEIYYFLLNGLVFKTKDLFNGIAIKENIDDTYFKKFQYRLAGRLMTILHQDPVLKARKEIEKHGGWQS